MESILSLLKTENNSIIWLITSWFKSGAHLATFHASSFTKLFKFIQLICPFLLSLFLKFSLYFMFAIMLSDACIQRVNLCPDLML
jgi:hypothetical protein